MRVLDLGSGAGDVAMLAARLVGPEGEVIGVERDPEAVASATARVMQAGLTNVRFIQGDAQKLDGVAGGFDAAVGRLVLMYFSDPADTLRRTAGLVRPRGLVLFSRRRHGLRLGCSYDAVVDANARVVFGSPRTGKSGSPHGPIVVSDFYCRWLATTRTAYGVRRGRRRQSLCLGLGERDAGSSAVNGAVGHHDCH
jgi:SAM-dependent methyltransferase